MITVAIIGRPNSGKSSLFNKIARKRKSIVGPKPGLTRDRVTEVVDMDKCRILLVDTGGFTVDTPDQITRSLTEQAMVAIEEADILIVLFDGKIGLTADDRELFSKIRRMKKVFLPCVNKIDCNDAKDNSSEFYELGVDRLFQISAEHSLGFGDFFEALEEEIEKLLVPEEAERYRDEIANEDGADKREKSNGLRICVLGRPNTGKSTLVNSISGKNRMIVSDVAGTTIDSVDSVVETEAGRVILVDTAGIRKKSNVTTMIEKVAVIKAIKSLKRSDVAIFMIDSVVGITDTDMKIAEQVYESGKCTIICVNKWDLYAKENKKYEDYIEWVYETLPYMAYAPVVFASAKDAVGVDQIIRMAFGIYESAGLRLKTKPLFETVKKIIEGRPMLGLRLHYATQLGARPPFFEIKVSRPEKISPQYKRYLASELRKAFNLVGSPVRIRITRKSKKS